MEDFWSVMVYDAETRSMIVNGQVPGLDSNDELKTNTLQKKIAYDLDI